jgi:hypothetical protein
MTAPMNAASGGGAKHASHATLARASAAIMNAASDGGAGWA